MLGAVGCADPTALGSLDEDGLGFAAAPLSADTEAAVIAFGRRYDLQPWGGEATIHAGAPSEARIAVRSVPEGDFQVAFAGYATRSFAPPNPVELPDHAYCVRDFADATARVASGGRAPPELSAVATAAECAHTGFDRYAVDADYTADPNHPFFGSPDGANVVAVYVDDWGDHAQLAIAPDPGGGSTPFGLFAELPDTATGGVWPDATAWVTDGLALEADSGGDARAFAVVRPGADPALRELVVTRVDSGESARVRIWIAPAAAGPGCSPADCDDANPCTSDACETDVCVHTPLADGTTCGSGLLCHVGACVPGSIVWPTSSLTGDCANDGTATTSFALMRCGNSLILGNPPLEIQRYAALSFDLSSLPAGLQLEAADLHVYQEMLIGDGLFTPGGLETVVAEHVSYTMLYGGCDAWVPIAGTIGQVPVSSGPALGWRTAEVTAAAQYGLGATPRRVQLRLRFVPNIPDGDGEDDLVAFASDNTVTPERVPFLLLHYAP